MGKGGYGKGGYGKGWGYQSRKGSWPSDHAHWRQGQWNPNNWQGHQAPSVRRDGATDSSLAHLCGGMISSAWEGVCSGVASAAWQAVQGTASALLKSRPEPNDPGKKSSAAALDVSGKSIMDCLAGQPSKASTVESHPTTEKDPAHPASAGGVTDRLVLTMLEMQKQQMEQHTALQQQLLQLQTANVSASPASSTEPVETHELDDCAAPAVRITGKTCPKPAKATKRRCSPATTTPKAKAKAKTRRTAASRPKKAAE